MAYSKILGEITMNFHGGYILRLLLICYGVWLLAMNGVYCPC